MPVPPLRARRNFAEGDAVPVPACLLRPQQPLDGLWTQQCGQLWGPVEHRIDAHQLRNEAAFIKRSQVPNCSIATILIHGKATAIVWATCSIAERGEVLLPADLVSQDPGLVHGADGDAVAATEASEPYTALDRADVQRLVGDEDGAWSWADEAGGQLPEMAIENRTSCASVAAIVAADAASLRDGAAVSLPMCISSNTTREHRHELVMSATRWLRAGAGSPSVQLGRYNLSRTTIGVFAQRQIARNEIICEYQGVLLTSPVGCSPWKHGLPPKRTHLLALATASHRGGMRHALRNLPEPEHSLVPEVWENEADVWLARCANETMRREVIEIYKQHNPEKLDQVNELTEKYGAAGLLQRCKEKYLKTDSCSEDTQVSDDGDANSAIARASSEAASRRRIWMSQLLGFIAAFDGIRTALGGIMQALTRGADDESAIGKERSAFAWCIKHDELTCADVPMSLSQLNLTEIEGVLQLYAEYGSTLPQLPATGNKTSLQTLGPGLAGIRHDYHNPSILLLATKQEYKWPSNPEPHVFAPTPIWENAVEAEMWERAALAILPKPEVAVNSHAVRRPKLLADTEIDSLLAAVGQIGSVVGRFAREGGGGAGPAPWETTYLHTGGGFAAICPKLRQKLLNEAIAVDKEQGWGLLDDSPACGPIRFRTVEYHEVRESGGIADPTHFDSGSLITIDVMLRRPEVDFVGGTLTTRETDGSVTAHTFNKGDVVIL